MLYKKTTKLSSNLSTGSKPICTDAWGNSQGKLSSLADLYQWAKLRNAMLIVIFLVLTFILSIIRRLVILVS
jgi:hypothetical protein